MRRELFIVTPKKCIFWILYACIVFSVAYSLFGISLSTFYLCDVLNLMLLYFEAKYIKQKAEAKELAQRYYERFKRRPDPEVFHEYGECYYCCIATKA